MRKDAPGAMECRILPAGEPHDLRRVYDGIKVDGEHAKRLLLMYLKKIPRPKDNAEKVTQMCKSIRQYVLAEYKDDSLYAAPTPEQEETTRAIKKLRRAERTKDEAASGKTD